MMKKLNLGCGRFVRDGYVNLDHVDLPEVDIVHDLNSYPYPFSDNEFDIIRCFHILEHLDDIIMPMEEIWRICKGGSRVLIEVPSFPGTGAIVDPTHKQFYTFGTFDYFTTDSQFDYYSKANYRIIKRVITFGYALFPLNIISSVLNFVVNKYALLQCIYFWNFAYFFPSSTIYVELEVIK